MKSVCAEDLSEGSIGKRDSRATAGRAHDHATGMTTFYSRMSPSRTD